MDFNKWWTFGIVITIAVFPLAEPSWSDLQSSPPRLNVTVTTIKQWLWKAGELVSLGKHGGSAVAQYTWTVKGIVDKINMANRTQDKIYSPSFYTDVPGYRLRLAMSFYDRDSSYMGLYLELIQGQFDDLVSWPFDNRYEFSSAGPDGTTFTSDSTNPSIECTPILDRPLYRTKSCGTNRYFDIDTLMSNKTRYLVNGAFNVNLTIYLDD